MELTFKNYQDWAVTKAGKHETKELAMCSYALGLAAEAGESADIIKKHVFHSHKLDKVALAKELGDTLYYLVMLAHENGFTLEQIAYLNKEKLDKRYPNGFSVEDSINRKE